MDVVLPGDESVDPVASFLARSKRLLRKPGRYLSIRNHASAKGLSSLTAGRLKDATTPRRCSVASMVEPFVVDCRPERGSPADLLRRSADRTTPLTQRESFTYRTPKDAFVVANAPRLGARCPMHEARQHGALCPQLP